MTKIGYAVNALGGTADGPPRRSPLPGINLTAENAESAETRQFWIEDATAGVPPKNRTAIGRPSKSARRQAFADAGGEVGVFVGGLCAFVYEAALLKFGERQAAGGDSSVLVH